MTWLLLAAAFAVLAIGAFYAKRRLDAIPNKKKKRFVKRRMKSVFDFFERRGWLAPEPAFDHEYHARFPALAKLEAGHPAVREECLALLENKDRLTDMSALGGVYTRRGIHTARWKVFLFKSGDFVAENCARCPRTAALLRDIPGVYTAFFSILEPHETITPHWGYYKGFLRYHLGVIVPNNNAERSCWLRVNPDPHANAARDMAAIEKGEVYYWREGEGVVFDDNYLHDAGNGSDQIRVVLWLDLARPMPLPLALFNRFCLWIAYREPSLRRFRKNALVVD